MLALKRYLDPLKIQNINVENADADVFEMPVQDFHQLIYGSLPFTTMVVSKFISLGFRFYLACITHPVERAQFWSLHIQRIFYFNI